MKATMIYAAVLVDKVGRRKLLMTDAFGAMITMFCLAAYSNISGSFNRVPPMDPAARATVAVVHIYALFYGSSWNGTQGLFTSEVLPNRVRTVGMATYVFWQWLTQFIVAYSLPHMIVSIGYGFFSFFGICSFVVVIFAWDLIRETTKVPLEDTSLIFGAGTP